MKKGTEIDSQIKSGESHEAIEASLLKRYRKRHNEVHFDRLPSCPLCLEKLDAAITGLQPAPSQLVKSETETTETQSQVWPGVIEECRVCKFETAELKEDDIKCQVCELR